MHCKNSQEAKQSQENVQFLEPHSQRLSRNQSTNTACSYMEQPSSQHWATGSMLVASDQHWLHVLEDFLDKDVSLSWDVKQHVSFSKSIKWCETRCQARCQRLCKVASELVWQFHRWGQRPQKHIPEIESKQESRKKQNFVSCCCEEWQSNQQ